MTSCPKGCRNGRGLYSLQAYEGGTLVMDRQPVLKNGVYLLKDAVTVLTARSAP